MKLSVVIPVYNEINTLTEILKKVQAVRLEKEIVIVDDYSTDGTREILEKISEKNIKVFFNDKNRGKGFSIRRGFEHVTGDIVIIQDADLEYYPDEYPQLLQKIIEGKADVVYGTRFLGARRVFHFYHYLGNIFLNTIANFLYNTNLSDMMTCYKAFGINVLRKLKLRADGFGIEAEMTAQIFKRRLRVYEVPISYDGRDFDEGKKISWKDFFRSLYWLVRCKFETYDVGEDTLYRMRLMKNNNKWAFDTIKPFLGKRVLEIGSGIGNISKFLAVDKNNLVALTDINENYLDYLRHRFVGNPKINVFNWDASHPPATELKRLNIDTVLCINVLEHIEDDGGVLDNIRNLMTEDGRLILIVPSLKALYGSLDEKLCHHRRYDKKELIQKLQERGYVIENIKYHNILSVPGWFVNSRILKSKLMSSFQIKLFDRLIPFISVIEKTVKIPFGMSLIAICRKKS
ncbi:MAG: glycosyltransferase [Elusimicrobiota bacterium]